MTEILFARLDEIVELDAANVTFTPGAGISSNTVNSALLELGTEKANIADLAAVAFSGTGSDIVSGNMGLTSLVITGGTLAPDTSVLSMTVTQPAVPTTTQNAVSLTVTGAGSAALTNRAFNFEYLAGFTGAAVSVVARFANFNAGTGSLLIPGVGVNNPQANSGVSGVTSGTTTGLNVGTTGNASLGDTNVGVLGLAQIPKTGAGNKFNIGVVGSAINVVTGGSTPYQIGGWFSLNQMTVPTVSAGLIADNGAQTDPIFLARDNGTTVFSIADGGAVVAGYTQATPATFPAALVVTGPTSGQTTLASVGGIEIVTATNGYSHKIQGISNAGGTLVFAHRQNSATWTEIASFNTQGSLVLNVPPRLVDVGGTGAGIWVDGFGAPSRFFLGANIGVADSFRLYSTLSAANIVSINASATPALSTFAFAGIAVVEGTEAATSTATGALRVSGGAGIVGKAYAAEFVPTTGAPGLVYSSTVTVDFNAAGDTAIPFVVPTGKTRILGFRITIYNASASIEAATFGLFPTTGGGGTALVAAGTAITVSSAADAAANNVQSTPVPQTSTYVAASLPTPSTIYFRVGATAAGTAKVVFEYYPLD